MRQSRVLKKLRAGEVVSCIKVHFDAQSSDIAGLSGIDCVWIDREHLAQDWSGHQAHILAAKSHDMDLLIRVSRGSYSDHIKPLEMDATGIMVPHVMGLEDAQKVVQMTRFHPIGRRALDGGGPDGRYAMMDYQDYIKQANDQRFVIVQIEDPEPLEELEDIAALDGIDMLFFGPGDFSQGIGAPGDWNHPRLLEARKRVAQVAQKHGKYAGTPGNMDNFEELIELGYRFINIGADVVGLGQYFKQQMEGFLKKINY